MLARAQTLAQVSRWAECAQTAGEIIAHEPDNAAALSLMARCQLGLGNAREAKTWAERAIAADPNAEWPHRLRSVAAETLGEKREARAAALESVRLAPHLPETHTALAQAELANRHFGAARTAAERALALDPTDPGAHNALGMIALRLRRAKEAEGHFRSALALDPLDPAAMNNLGLALEKRGNKRAAIHYYSEASKLDPRDSTARSNASRAAQVGAGGVIVTVVVTRLVINLTSDPDASPDASDDQPAFVTVVDPDPSGAAGSTGTVVRLERNTPDRSEPVPGWLVASLLLLFGGATFVALVVGRRRREEKFGDPVADRDLIRQIRKADRGAASTVRGSWLGVRALLAIGLVVTTSVAWAGFASVSRDGLSGWLFGVGGLAASVALVLLSLPRLRRTR